MSIDRLSLSTIPIVPFFNDRELAVATGFVWKRRERFYLITNWHVLSALSFFTKEHLSPVVADQIRYTATFSSV